MFSDVNLLFPPNYIKKSYYRCDKKYHLDELLLQYENGFTIGYALISGKECHFYNVEFNDLHYNIKSITLLKKYCTKLQKKQKKGGQSAQRIGRIREEKSNCYKNKIIEFLLELYNPSKKNKQTNKIIIAGPAELKKEIINKLDCTNIEVLGVISTEEVDIRGGTINSVIEKSYEYLMKKQYDEQNKVLAELFDIELKNPDQLLFGDEIYSAINDLTIKSVITSNLSLYNQFKNTNEQSSITLFYINTKIHPEFIYNMVGIKWY